MLRRDPCSFCGGPGGQVDHIVPRRDGGTDSLDNLAGVCGSCNSTKRHRSLLGHLLLARVDREYAPLHAERQDAVTFAGAL